MAESIFVRVHKVVTAQVGSGLDAAERASSASLMRQAIRDVDRAADELRAEHEAAKARRVQAARQQQQIRERLATLEEQARFTLGKGRDDLAEAVIARQLEFEAQAKQLEAAEAEAAEEMVRFDEAAAAIKTRRAQMEKELAAFEATRRDASAAIAAAATPELRSERKAARAEAAFERAMAAAGLSVGLADPGEAAKLAEVEALQKDAAIAARLEALKAKASAPRPKSRGKAAGA
ncbi:MAG: PspA/IM30 family protein [Allosphingosinicella sp.]